MLQDEAIQKEQVILTELENKLSIMRKQTSEAVEKVTLAKEQLLDWQNLDKYTEEVATLEAEKDFYQSMEVRMNAAKRASNLQSQDALCIRLKEQLEAAEQTEKQVVVEAEQVKTQFLHAKNKKKHSLKKKQN